MGFDASLTVVPRGAIRKSHRLSTGLARFELYRVWADLQPALDALGRPLDLVLRGNRPMTEDNDDSVHALVTPALVKPIHTALGTISAEQLLEAIHANRKKTDWRLRKYEWGVAAEEIARLNLTRLGPHDAGDRPLSRMQSRQVGELTNSRTSATRAILAGAG